MNTRREFIPKNPNQNFSRNNNYNNNNNKNSKKSRSIKNLSPAKKFRLRLRRAKLQKRQQVREEYFEHDMRENNRNKRRKPNIRYRNYKRLSNFPNKNNNNIEMKIDNKNEDSNLELVESTSHKTNSISSYAASSQEIMSKSLVRSEQAKNEEISSTISHYPTTTNTNTNAGNFSSVKCCCHCACSGSSKRKPRRKLSSPYLGDFSQIMHFAGGSKCLNAANELTTEVLNKTIMTQHEKFIKTSGGQINYDIPAFSSTYMQKSAGENVKIRNERNGIRTMRFVLIFVN
jgi:hypothetical protein